jgi:HPt (histidine-containing phosphotransfer) domain-containing protein
MIANWLEKGTTTSALPEKATVHAPLYNLYKLEQISPGNNAFIKKMLQLFLQEVPMAIQLIHAALNENNLAIVQASAHRIKPILANLDIVCLKEVILNIERIAAERKPSPELNGLVGKLAETIELVVADMRIYLAAS